MTDKPETIPERNSDLTLTQKSALHNCHNNGPTITIKAVTARALIAGGYMEQSSVWPVPTTGIAVHLTTKGQSYCITGGPK